MRSRILSLLAVTAASAFATWGTRQLLASAKRSRSHAARPALETWEGEGGNLHPRETRSLQQQLG